MKNSRKIIVSSFIMVLTCCLLFAGATFAWFSDSVSSNNNIIKAGNLDVELEYWDGTNWIDVDGSSELFDQDTLWEPGVTEVVYLKLSNVGSLAFKCELSMNIVSETSGVNVEGDLFNLSDYIYFDVNKLDVTEENPFAPYASRAEAMDTTTDLYLISDGYVNNMAMLSGEEYYYAMVVYMPTTVGNEANHDGSNIPEINLGINLVATQFNYEKDTFDEYYDSLAVYPDGGHRVNNSLLEAAAELGEAVSVTNAAKTFTVKAVAGDQGSIKASIVATTPTQATTNIASERQLNVISYKIDVTGQADNTDTEVELFVGKSLMGVVVYRNGKALDDYSYNPTTGFVTFKMPLSKSRTLESGSFDITFTQCDSIISSYADITAAKGKDGNHVLSADMDADNIIFFGNGTTNTIDLNGHTITALNESQFILGVQNGASLTVNGNGVVNAGKGFMTNKGDATIEINGGTYNTTVTTSLNGMKFSHLAQNNSKIIINGGIFTTNVDNAALFMATSNATIEINGGFFENTVDKTPDLLEIGTNKSNTNRIVIKGGTFVNYNPLEDKMCYKGEWPANGYQSFGGPWMIIWEGYTVVSETQANGDVWYTVVPVSSVN